MKKSKLVPLALLALVAIIPFYYRHQTEEPETSNEDEVSLMQTSLIKVERSTASRSEQAKVASEQPAKVAREQAAKADSLPGNNLNANFDANVISLVESAGLGVKFLRDLEPCSTDFVPVHLQAQTELLQLFGAMPPREPCRPASLLQSDSELESSSNSSEPAALPMLINVNVPKGRTMVALCVPILYVSILGFIIIRMIYTVLWSKPKAKESARHGTVRRPESEAWKQGLISWLSISWATEWIQRWGNVTNSSSTSIRAEELDGLGDPNDEPEVGHKKLLVIWEQELRRYGLKNASVVRVMFKFVTLWRIMLLVAWTVLYESAMYLGPPLAMQWTIGYIVMLYTLRLQGWDIPTAALTVPSLFAILTFTGLPVMIGVCNTVSSFLSQRMAMQTCGALSSLVVRKAQCLPVRAVTTMVEKEKAAAQEAAAGTALAENDEVEQIIKEIEADDEKAAKESMLSMGGATKEGETKAKGIEAARLIQDGEGDPEKMDRDKAPETFSLVQVVANDINMNFIQLPLQIVRTIVILPVVVTLFVLLWRKVKCTIFLVLTVAFVMTGLTMKTAAWQITHLMSFLNLVGVRLQYMESTIFSIRTVKACGWEGIVCWRIQEMRAKELESLENYYWRLGLMYTIIYAVPKAMIFVSIWGFHWLYPEHESVNIFATLPLLFTAQSAIMNVLQTLPALINARPSITRCEGFLKQSEAPTGKPKSDKKAIPTWVRLWPKAIEPAPSSSSASSFAVQEPTSFGTGTLRVKGSFSWEEKGKPTLQDMDINLKNGKSLAIIGHTGCGKTTFLHAILGELYPIDDGCVEVPDAMSYSSQVPYICEGTLRENVLFGEPIDEEHYKTAIYSACLLPDLEMLPGGEEVPIGSRGISLSGGQKARVSMARAAYHSCKGGLVLLDDPFGAVDSRTARHLLDNLVHGRGLEGRTRIVVTQPDPERIARFDQVAILQKGKIVVQGTPGEVMETDVYQALLNSQQVESLKRLGDGDALNAADSTGRGEEVAARKNAAPEVFQLREEEFQGRVDFKTLNYFCSAGKWHMIICCVFIYFFQQLCYLMMNVSLQHWSTDQMEYSAGIGRDPPRPITYMWGFLAWFAASNVIWAFCWSCGVWFTVKMSTVVFQNVVKGLMHAPTDRFFDRTPTGRIMNRLSTDLSNLDNNTYNHITICFGLCWSTMVPVAYIHFLMPLYFTVLTMPVYYLIFSLVRRYWNTMVPMRYLTHVSKSSTDDLLTEVQHSNTSVRAMQKADFRLGVFQSLLSNQMKADVATSLVLQRWLVNRLFLLLGFFITVLLLIAVWVPHVISFGGIGLALASCFQVVTSIEQYINSAAQAQFQFISLNRLYEYTKLPQERPNEMASDGKYKTFAVQITRAVLGKLFHRQEGGVIKIFREKAGGEELLLVQDPGTETFAAALHKNMGVLAEHVRDLEETTSWHRVVACSGVRGDALKLADKLCDPQLETAYVEVATGWLTQGAEVIIEDLRAGYGDIPRDVLRDVNLIVDPRSKAGIVGTTGCGKSTLLLSLLRILEPREGRVLINGVDTTTIGLQTLRTAVGLVPQDPVLLQCSVRENLDPWWLYTDEEIWKGLAMVQLQDVVKNMEYGIWSPIAADGGNLSFGQRQLLCLARTVIRQPSLILLDEATSALDPATQELVQKTIESSFPLSTIIVIAHRLETILNFDTIIVMEKGSIAEKGSPNDLAQVKNGLFSKMLAAKRTW